jgi:hypothetical protein
VLERPPRAAILPARSQAAPRANASERLATRRSEGDQRRRRRDARHNPLKASRKRKSQRPLTFIRRPMQVRDGRRLGHSHLGRTQPRRRGQGAAPGRLIDELLAGARTEAVIAGGKALLPRHPEGRVRSALMAAPATPLLPTRPALPPRTRRRGHARAERCDCCWARAGASWVQCSVSPPLTAYPPQTRSRLTR